MTLEDLSKMSPGGIYNFFWEEELCEEKAREERGTARGTLRQKLKRLEKRADRKVVQAMRLLEVYAIKQTRRQNKERELVERQRRRRESMQRMEESGLNRSEIARQLGVSKQYVGQVLGEKDN